MYFFIEPFTQKTKSSGKLSMNYPSSGGDCREQANNLQLWSEELQGQTSLENNEKPLAALPEAFIVVKAPIIQVWYLKSCFCANYVLIRMFQINANY